MPRKPKADKTADKTAAADKAAAADRAGTTPMSPRAAAAKGTPDTPPADRPRQDNGGAQIVSLDAFRKK